MAELSSADFWGVVWLIVKYILSGISIFFLWFIGKFGKEHMEMYRKHLENTGDMAKELKEIEKSEYKEIIDAIKDLKHSVNQLRQDKANISIFSNQLERIEDDIRELKSK